MRFLLRTLSLSYVRRHWAKTLVTLLGVIVGVATFHAIQSARTTLIGGLRKTVDRMAGKAQLQVASDGGVPEEMLEKLRDLKGLRATAPVIEQIVVPETGTSGSLLVLGVDLLGDREMRDYGFEGEDADLDDPLLFLAQADSVALAGSVARSAGVKVGDRFAVRVPQGTKNVVVRGLLEAKGFAEAFGGNIAVMDVYAAQMVFGRGRRFDRIEMRLEDGVSIAEASRTVRAAVGPGYRVETPDRRSEQLEKLIANFVVGFNLSSVFALGIGTFLIFNAFTVSVERRRRDIGTLRALGATPRQVQALFLLEATAVGLAGALVGLAVGALLADAALATMGGAVAKLYGIREAGSTHVGSADVLHALLLGVGASLAGAWLPASAAARVPPTAAIAMGSYKARVRPFSIGRIVAGAALLAASILVARSRVIDGIPLFWTVLALGLASTLLLVAPAARGLIVLACPVLARLSPVAGRLAADSLLSNPRRTAGTVIAMTLSLAFVLGTGSYIESNKITLTRWMDDILTADLYVRGSANFSRPDYRYSPEVGDEIRAIPGVSAVEGYRAMRVPFRGDEVMLLTIEIEPMLSRTRHDFLEGNVDAMRQGLVHERKIAVSDNFSRRFGVHMGDSVELSTPSGDVKIPVAAVVHDYSSDRGTIWVDRAVFVSPYGDDRIDTFDVSVRKGIDPIAVREAIRAKLGGRMPALVSTRKELTAEIGVAIDSFYSLMQVTLMLSLFVAFLGIVSSLLISVSERTREIGILKALGALGGQIRRSVVFEALGVAAVALVLAIPLGSLDARFLENVIARVFAGWIMPHESSWLVLGQLVVALPIVSALAAWVPAGIAARTGVVDAIEYE